MEESKLIVTVSAEGNPEPLMYTLVPGGPQTGSTLIKAAMAREDWLNAANNNENARTITEAIKSFLVNEFIPFLLMAQELSANGRYQTSAGSTNRPLAAESVGTSCCPMTRLASPPLGPETAIAY